MEIDKNKLNYNNIKLKIKISELKNKSLTLKSFPSLKLNSPKDSIYKGKYLINNTIKRTSTSSSNNKNNNKIEKMKKENLHLKKKLEFLEEENKQLRNENKELKNKKDLDSLNISLKNTKYNNSSQKENKYKYNNLPIRFNSSLITPASRYFINLRKATIINEFGNSMNHDYAYTISNTIDTSNINNSKVVKFSSFSNRNQNCTNSLDNEFDIKIQLNDIKKRTLKLFDKYYKILK